MAFFKKRKVRLIEKIHERALRVVYNEPNLCYVDLLNKGKRQTLHYERLRLIAIQVYKSLRALSPPYVNELFQVKTSKYDFRHKILLIQPMVKTVNYGILSIRYHGPKVWNNLPESIKSADNLDIFKKRLYEWNGTLCNCSFCVGIH